tara:strand:- start:1831 stop:4752 length:2922 start_codon:yes stop_codon:yes gene_type:complete
MGSVVNTILSVVVIAVSVMYPPVGIAVGGGFTFSAFNFAIVVGATMVAGALSVKPKVKNSSLQQASYQTQTANRSTMLRQPIISRETIYGITKKSGGILFVETSDNNKYVHMIVQVASHEIQSFDEVYFNDEELTLSSAGNDENGIARFNVTAPSTYATDSIYEDGRKTVRIKLHKGSDDQLADADLVAECEKWTNDHRLRGIAYIYIRLAYDPDVFQGIPNVSAVIKGKKILDIRDSSTAFSSNPALVLYDYLTDQNLGLGIDTVNIDTASFTSLANLCDTTVSLSAGGTEKKYESHGIIFSDIAPMENIDNILTSFIGTLAYSNGKFTLSGGQFTSPSVSLDESDFVAELKLVAKQSRKDMFNTVKGLFTSDESNWQPTDYPMVTSSTFVEGDGEVIFADIDLPFTKSSTMAQRLGKIVLFKNRQQMSLSCQVSMKAFTLQVGDTVQISNTRLGFDNKIFQVADWSFSLSRAMTIELSLQETSSSVYDWNAEETAFSLDNTTLPRTTDVSAPSVIAVDELRTFAETPLAVLIVTCSSNQGTTNEFEVEAQNTNIAGSEFINLGKSRGNVFELVNAQDGAIYNIRARSVNAFNVYSAFTTIQHTVVGKTAPPSDVTDFSVNIINGMAELSWTPVSDLDLSHYIVRHTPDTTSPTFEEGMILAEKVSKPASTVSLPARNGTYMIKAIDVLGISSLNSTKSVVILNDIDYNFNVVSTSTQNPSFSGTKSDVFVLERAGVSYLQLLTGELFDDASGNFDSQSGNFDEGGSTADNVEGFYDFPVIDVGGIFTSRVTINCDFTRFDPTSLFDAFGGNFDSREGLFDGSYTEFDDINVQIKIATSNDNSSYTAYRNYVLGDYKARYIKLRAVLTTTGLTSAPAISTLSATVDMPDRTFGDGSISSGTASGGKVITYSPAFKEVQALGISASNLETGDFYEITNKTATGFTIKFKNSSNAVVDRTFDYVAKGYGNLESS